jgi:hypothetical protein
MSSTVIPAPEGFEIIRREKDPASGDFNLITYDFSVITRLKLMVTAESEADPAYLDAHLRYGIENLARGTQKLIGKVLA